MLDNFNHDTAKYLDKEDSLSKYRDLFFFPKHNGKKCLYFSGNSLGLQLKRTEEYIKTELNDWAIYGVDGHFKAKNPCPDIARSNAFNEEAILPCVNCCLIPFKIVPEPIDDEEFCKGEVANISPNSALDLL